MKPVYFKKKLLALGIALVLLVALAAPALAADAAPANTSAPEAAEAAAESGDAGSVTGTKAMAAAIAVGLAAAAGAIAMGMATAKSAECIARQPEAEGKVRTTLMLGLVFIETAIIYALLVVILIIFVL